MKISQNQLIQEAKIDKNEEIDIENERNDKNEDNYDIENGGAKSEFRKENDITLNVEKLEENAVKEEYQLKENDIKITLYTAPKFDQILSKEELNKMNPNVDQSEAQDAFHNTETGHLKSNLLVSEKHEENIRDSVYENEPKNNRCIAEFSNERNCNSEDGDITSKRQDMPYDHKAEFSDTRNGNSVKELITSEHDIPIDISVITINDDTTSSLDFTEAEMDDDVQKFGGAVFSSIRDRPLKQGLRRWSVGVWGVQM